MTNLQPALAPETKQQHHWPIVVSILLVILAAIGIGYLVTTVPQTPLEARNPLAVNPELMILPLYEDITPRNTLAENPELMAFQAYTGQELNAAQPRDFLAVNPELSSYYRYANK